MIDTPFYDPIFSANHRQTPQLADLASRLTVSHLEKSEDEIFEKLKRLKLSVNH